MGFLITLFFWIMIPILIGWLTRKHRAFNWESFSLAAGPVSFICFIFLALSFIVGGTESGNINAKDAQCTKTSGSVAIISLNRNTESRGTFVLGTGNIGSITYYYVYEKERLGYKLYKYRTSNTHIVEDSTQTPKLKYDNYKCKKSFLSFMWFGTYYRHYHTWNKQLIVPKNTILREFKL